MPGLEIPSTVCEESLLAIKAGVGGTNVEVVDAKLAFDWGGGGGGMEYVGATWEGDNRLDCRECVVDWIDVKDADVGDVEVGG